MHSVWIALHIFGTVIGAGAVTTAYARELYFRSHPEEIAKRGSLPVITPLLNIGFAVIILSGFGLYLANPAEFNASTGFIIKIALVLVLLLNHVFLNAFLRAKRSELKTLSVVSDYVSLLGWYAIIAVSVAI